MSGNYEDEEIECEIIESYGVFSGEIKSWNKEVKLVSWNGKPAKLDIRAWRKDQKKCGKGIAITREEAEELVKLLSEILKKKPAKERLVKEKKSSVKKRPQVPLNLKPFYNELKLFFGAGPEECKSARNILLKKYHPDKYTGNIIVATKKTIKIKEAYEKIMEWWKKQS